MSSSLIDFIKTGDVENFNKFADETNLEKEISLNQRPIHLTCQLGNAEILQLLINKKCSIESQDDNNWRPIHFACWRGHINIVQTLINNNCNIEACDKWNNRPIHFACMNGHVYIAKLLIHKCNINERNEYNKQPIHYACEKGHAEIVKLLIKNKCSINMSDKYKQCPIHLACLHGHVEIVKILLNNHCNTNAVNIHNQSPLDIAKIIKKKEIIDILEQQQQQQNEDEQIQKMIDLMELKCDENCPHRFCSKSLKSRDFQKGKKVGKKEHSKTYYINGAQNSQKFIVKRLRWNKESEEIKNYINGTLINLQHDKIIRYFGAIVKSKRLCIFMEYLKGESLEDKIQKENTISVDISIRYCKQLLEALAYLEEKKIVHAKIRPENIFLDQHDHIKLASFNYDQQNTIFDETDKSYVFIAPEVRNGKHYTYSSDIWSLGVTFTALIIHKISDSLLNYVSDRKYESHNMPEQVRSLIKDMLLDTRPGASQLLCYKLFAN